MCANQATDLSRKNVVASWPAMPSILIDNLCQGCSVQINQMKDKLQDEWKYKRLCNNRNFSS